jgi:hypothetical protein
MTSRPRRRSRHPLAPSGRASAARTPASDSCESFLLRPTTPQPAVPPYGDSATEGSSGARPCARPTFARLRIRPQWEQRSAGQATRRHPEVPPYRCCLSALTGFEGLRRAGPARTLVARISCLALAVNVRGRGGLMVVTARPPPFHLTLVGALPGTPGITQDGR